MTIDVSIEDNTPHVSVVIPTCNRPDDIRRCLDCLTAVTYESWDILLIDQSDDDYTAVVVEQFKDTLPHLIYRHIEQKWTARARSLGLNTTTGDIIAYLDDDCTVLPDWLDQVASAFMRHPQAALVFGTVKSAPTIDPRFFFVPIYPITKEHVIRGALAFIRPDGMGASMYVRRTAAQRIGSFDACLGPGSRLYNGGEDNDYIYRCLANGYSVVRTPSIVLEHYGARSYASGAVSRLVLGNARSAAAVDMKLLRCGHLEALIIMASHSVYFVLEAIRRHPAAIQQLAIYMRTLVSSWRLKVDRTSGLFVEPVHP